MALAVARGFANLRQRGPLNRRVAVECVQPEGNNTIAGPLKEGLARAKATMSTTAVSGLQVASVIDGDEVIAACRDCGGTGHLVTDAQVYEAQARLAREEGIFSEPAGAVALAGALAARATGYLDAEAPVVCFVTSSGFKDEPSVLKMIGAAECPLLDSADQIESVL